jgi:pimeloyl-ACP methyl ester carboxylesterase
MAALRIPQPSEQFLMKRKIAIAFVVLVITVGILLAWLAYRVKTRVEGQYFDSNGVQIHYTDEGQGEPVILIHGFAANADLNWRLLGITQALANEYRVIVLDNRGHGLSDKPHDAEQYGVEMVRDVIRLMDHLQIEKAHVVGYSMGGFITLKLAIMFPDRLFGAAPCGAGWQVPGEQSAFREELAEALEARGDFGPLYRMLDPRGKGLGPVALWLTNNRMGTINDTAALAAVMRSLSELTVTEEELRANQVPTLSIVGTEDPLRRGVERMTSVMSNHEVYYVEGANHITTLGSSEFIQEIRSFIEAHRPVGVTDADAA